MLLECELLERLPRLSWCARIVRGRDVAEVAHGPWVETWPDAFCEGAWDGPFELGRFAEAVTFAGSGSAATSAAASLPRSSSGASRGPRFAASTKYTTAPANSRIDVHTFTRRPRMWLAVSVRIISIQPRPTV